MSLSGSVVMITGAGRRIGRFLATRFLDSGAVVILHTSGQNHGAEDLVAQALHVGRQAIALQADFEDPREAAGLMARAWSFAPVDYLINNAAIFEPLEWDNTNSDDWHRHQDVNLTAPFLLSKEFASLRKPDPGVILNILDWRALRPGADHLPYTISKAALAALTRSLAIGMAPEIRVNGLALGAILPPSDGSSAPEIPEKVPAGRWARLEEVFQAVEFLLTGPDTITGQILRLDGGRHLV